MLTVQNILDYIEDNLNKNDWMGGYADGTIPGVKSKLVEDVGGEEQGSTFYAVWEFRDEETDQLIGYAKFDGWYASYSGAEFNIMFEVEPQEKTITVYS